MHSVSWATGEGSAGMRSSTESAENSSRDRLGRATGWAGATTQAGQGNRSVRIGSM
jgi:hypothetical protein